MDATYFTAFEDRKPPNYPAPTLGQHIWFHIAVGMTVGFGVWYFIWRWSFSLNPNAVLFSTLVAVAETGMFLSGLLFFYDIWRVEDTPRQAPILGAKENGSHRVDIYIATFNEAPELLEATILDAKAVRHPPGWKLSIYLLDDGRRKLMRDLAAAHSIHYLTRPDNRGFKAGNLKNALFDSAGDFIVICDADTRLFASFLENTLGYFNDPKVAWVQTPHWFYDLPEGRSLLDFLPARFVSWLPKKMRAYIMKYRLGQDPYFSEGGIFFDVIQRRRNRNGASFCCGAGSIHRRESLMQAALSEWSGRVQKSRLGSKASVELTPFCYHISEDILTSIRLHSDPDTDWQSVYHPQIEAKMLSPWNQAAWAGQRLRYATGAIDILLRHNPLFSRGMDWRKKLHYASTFMGYLSTFFCLILIAAPIFTLTTDIAPVASYTSDFFLHLLPLLAANQVALLFGCAGHDSVQGSAQSTGCIGVTLRAVWLVAWGSRIAFKPTPKTGACSGGVYFRFTRLNLTLIFTSLGALVFAASMQFFGIRGLDWPLLIVNGFWVIYNSIMLSGPVWAALFPPVSPQIIQNEISKNRSITYA